MIKNKIRKNLLEYHDIHRKKSSLHNLKSCVQSLADSVRYIESACEEIDNPKIVDELVKIKNIIMTDSGLGTGFDESVEPDTISKIQNIVNHMDKNLRKQYKKENLPTFF
jgi:hypothetical protein